MSERIKKTVISVDPKLWESLCQVVASIRIPFTENSELFLQAKEAIETSRKIEITEE